MQHESAAAVPYPVRSLPTATDLTASANAADDRQATTSRRGASGRDSAYPLRADRGEDRGTGSHSRAGLFGP
jgi:hypothetical protein